ncbi:Regulator of G-protein signaling 12 [Nymphon striatum]|nr:Regulator of G-protein signaling 12 [Nymphon striatum]
MKSRAAKHAGGIVKSNLKSEKAFVYTFHCYRIFGTPNMSEYITGGQQVDLKVEITRKNTEYGFRINGSRPVVISAIEPGTPAETCSLEIGDIIISVNDVNVLEFNHGEVVELAHTGIFRSNLSDKMMFFCFNALNYEKNEFYVASLLTGEVLTLEIARTIDCILPSTDEKDRQLPKEDPLQSKQTGYIYKLCDKGQVWKRRWFSLDTDTKILLFYKNKQVGQDREPLGVTYLPHYKPPEQITDHARPFTFQLTAHSPGGQPLTLSAGRQNEASSVQYTQIDVLEKNILFSGYNVKCYIIRCRIVEKLSKNASIVSCDIAVFLTFRYYAEAQIYSDMLGFYNNSWPATQQNSIHPDDIKIGLLSEFHNLRFLSPGILSLEISSLGILSMWRFYRFPINSLEFKLQSLNDLFAVLVYWCT